MGGGVIAASLAAFINTRPEFAAANIALKAFAKTPDTVLGEIPVPFALVSPLTERSQELWEIGDAHRKENPIFQVAFYAKSYWQVRHYETIFRRLIESAKATDLGGIIHPGIDYLMFADFLRDSGDHATYFSDQPGWFASPAPVVYLDEDSNDEPIMEDPNGYGSSGFGSGGYGGNFSVDLAAGSITFTVPNDPTDTVRASYKCGVIDFNIVGVAKFETAQESDVANNPQRFVVAFTLEPHFYIKANANRYL